MLINNSSTDNRLLAKKFLFFIFLMLTLNSCGGGDTSSKELSPDDNVSYSLSWGTPGDGDTLFPHTYILLQVNTEDPEEIIDKIDFLVNGLKIAEDTEKPYEHTWLVPEEKILNFSARAWNIYGENREISINVQVGNTLNVPADYPNIQDAISNASDGDTVLITPGTYQENLSITDKKIALTSLFHTTSDESIIENTVIDGRGNTVIYINNANDSLISGLTIQNGQDGISAYSTIDIVDNHITNNVDGIDYEGGGGTCKRNILSENADDAIDLDEASEVEISDNTIIDNLDDGIEIRLHPYDGQEIAILIKNNIIQSNGEDGIQLIGYDGPSNRTFRIERNLIAHNTYAGIGLMDSGNTIEDFRGAPVPDRIVLINNTFIGNDHALTGGANLIAINNLIIGSTNIGIKNLNDDSLAAHSLFWGNNNDFSNSNIDMDNTLFSDPLLDENYLLSIESPAVDAGTYYYLWQEEVILNISNIDYLGNAPDLGAYEKQ